MTFPFPLVSTFSANPLLVFKGCKALTSSGTSHSFTFDLGNTRTKRVVVVAGSYNDGHQTLTVDGDSATKRAEVGRDADSDGAGSRTSIWDIVGSYGGNTTITLTTDPSSDRKGMAVYLIEDGQYVDFYHSNTHSLGLSGTLTSDINITGTGIVIVGSCTQLTFTSSVFSGVNKDLANSASLFSIASGSNTFSTTLLERVVDITYSNAEDMTMAIASYS